MYFDLEDRRPDTPVLDRPLTRLEQILLTIIGYLLIVIAVIIMPRLPFVKAYEAAQKERLEKIRQQQLEIQKPIQYVFSIPKVQLERIPPRPKFLSDESHTAMTMEKPVMPKNDVTASRGNSPEKIIEPPKAPQNSQPANAPAASDTNPMAVPTQSQATIARNDTSKNPLLPPQPAGQGILSKAIQNVGRYSQGETLQNIQGNGDFGPSFQFDAKGVDFGSWLRRFRAQVYSNWNVPFASIALHGHTVLRFTIHKDGTITDLIILQPSSVNSFTTSSFNAIKSSNPTVPLPSEYPDDKMVMTCTFYINENPSGGG
jgi:outer membrane biosynthesis protein TonB